MIARTDEPGIWPATHAGSKDEITAQQVVVERIWTKVIGPRPAAPVSGNDSLRPYRDWAIRCVDTLKREAEIRENLGFAAIRNPAAHDGADIDETVALEQLASLSMMARWVDGAELTLAGSACSGRGGWLRLRD